MTFVFPTRVIFEMQNISAYVSNTLQIPLSQVMQHKVKAGQAQGQAPAPPQPLVAAALLAVVAALDHGSVPRHLVLASRRSLNLGLKHVRIYKNRMRNVLKIR